MTPNPRSPLEDYSLHIIDLHTGRLCDTRSFKCDKIILSHNQGLYLYRNILAVLSVQQQTIHVFQVGTAAFFVNLHLFTFIEQKVNCGVTNPKPNKMIDQFEMDCFSGDCGCVTEAYISIYDVNNAYSEYTHTHVIIRIK